MTEQRQSDKDERDLGQLLDEFAYCVSAFNSAEETTVREEIMRRFAPLPECGARSFGSVSQCKATSQNMTIGGTAGWQCHTCGANRDNPACRYAVSASGTNIDSPTDEQLARMLDSGFSAEYTNPADTTGAKDAGPRTT